MLSVPDIIDVLVSFRQWQKERECTGDGWGEIYFEREGHDAVKILRAWLYAPDRRTYQTLKVTGPVLKYITTINVCDESANRELGGCDSVMENEVEVVSKRLVKVNQKVLRGGFAVGVADGDCFSCTFEKK